MTRILAALSLCVLSTGALGQHNHNAGHGDYRNWSSGVTQSCCDDRDCGELKPEEVRETPSGTEILISGQWCPVKPEHYITKGKSPDWNAAHACVAPHYSYYENKSPCERLLCFAGVGLF